MDMLKKYIFKRHFSQIFKGPDHTFFNASFMSKDLSLIYRCTHYLDSFLNFALVCINFLVTIHFF